MVLSSDLLTLIIASIWQYFHNSIHIHFDFAIHSFLEVEMRYASSNVITMFVRQSVHLFDQDWNISKIVEWITMTFGKDINGPLRINCIVFKWVQHTQFIMKY